MAADKPSSKGQAWFCTTGLPSDVVIDVDDMTFHLHKFPLMSKSRRLHELITEQETNPPAARVQRNSDDEDVADGEEIEEHNTHISLPNFPGGSEAFETAAKFCYGVKIEISSSNVASLRCAGEFLEMTEEYSPENLISKTEMFLSQWTLKSLRDSIKTLKSCENLNPMAEALRIVQRCIDSIAARASRTADPSLFGWTDAADPAGGQSPDSGSGRNGANRASASGSWLEELGGLSLPLFNRLIVSMKAKDLSADIIEHSLISYAKRYIPGISRPSRKPSTSSVSSEKEQRVLLETVVSNLPEGNSRSSSALRSLFGLLRTAKILNASDHCKVALEKKIGSQLEHATLDELLIPSYSYLNETLYDIECVERMVRYFLHGLEERSPSRIGGENNGDRARALMLAGKLIDGYLSEIASDANLKPEKFFELAVALPEQSRLYDDGLYRAVDVYLRAHPWTKEPDREKICGAMDWQKLTLEACTHAAQNDRLPVRAVVQVLFSEQLQLRQAIAGTLLAADGAHSEGQREERPRQVEGGWKGAVRENRVLRVDMDSMRTRVHELERECSTMRKAIESLDPQGGGWRGSLTRKFGCKFKTQVCDSHERTVVEAARQGRSSHRRPHRRL